MKKEKLRKTGSRYRSVQKNGYRVDRDSVSSEDERIVNDIEEIWKTPGWNCGKFVLPSPEEILKLSEFVIEIRKIEVELLEMIKDEIAEEDGDKTILKEAIDQLKWQLNPENVIESDLPPIEGREVADLALLASYFYEIFNQIRTRFIDIIEHSRKKWHPSITKARKFYQFRKSIEKLKKEMDIFLETLDLSLDGRKLINKCKYLNSTET